MRLPLLCAFPVAVAVAFAACSQAPPPKAPAARAEPELEPPPPLPPPPQYLIVDPDALPHGTALALDEPGSFGAIVDGSRVVATADALRVARDGSDPALTLVQRIPAWLGGGFLFGGRGALYTAEAFDGELKPLVALPSAPAHVSFGPRSMLLRSSDGHRWALAMPGGAPVEVAPLGLVDEVALADGRALALTSTGQLLLSFDRGEHWSEATAQLGGAPQSITTAAGDLWVLDDAGRAHRLEPGGSLATFDKIPTPPPARIRPRDPAWHVNEAPLHAAVRRGAKLDDSTAIVAAGGNVFRVDLHTGTATAVAAGRLPPDLPCEALRTPDDVLVVCSAPHRPSVVMSGLVGEGHPHVERTFATEGPYFGADDGALAYGGACDGRPAPRAAVCYRDAHGEWTELRDERNKPDGGAAVLALDGGAVEAADVVRWIPRLDGTPLGVAVGPKVVAVVDPVGGTTRLVRLDDNNPALHGDLARAIGVARRRGTDQAIIDTTWRVTPAGSLRGWLDHEAVTVTPAGEVERSAFTFDASVRSGRFALGRDHDGRFFQTLDGGDAWVEVAGPPHVHPAGSPAPRGCTPVGCDLGPWIRVGWEPTPPAPRAEPVVAPPPHALAHPLRRELACTSAGEEKVRQLAAGPMSPDDLGLGAVRLPAAGDRPDGRSVSYKRHLYARALINPAFGYASDDERIPRALLHGYSAEFNGTGDARNPLDGIVVHGPSAGAQSFQRTLSFVEPFDPGGTLRSAGFGTTALLAVARGTALSLGQLFSPEGPDLDEVLPVLPMDPAAPSDLLFTLPSDAGEMVGTVTAGKTTALRFAGVSPGQGSVVSAVQVGAKDIAYLVASQDGTEQVFRLGPGGVSSLQPVPGLAGTEFATANPDALAIGAQGVLAIIRTPSGGDPPTAADPALLIPATGGPPIALAPWSTLTRGDDPACRADAAGYRAVLQTAAPWLHLQGATVRPDALAAAMSARVRWSPTRVCLEAVELPDGSVPRHSAGAEPETEVVARFVAPVAAGRVAVTPGFELRQPLTCTLVP